jgi:hypothetical protein
MGPAGVNLSVLYGSGYVAVCKRHLCRRRFNATLPQECRRYYVDFVLYFHVARFYLLPYQNLIDWIYYAA